MQKKKKAKEGEREGGLVLDFDLEVILVEKACELLQSMSFFSFFNGHYMKSGGGNWVIIGFV